MSIVAVMTKAHLHDHIHEERTPGIGVSMVIVVVIFLWKRNYEAVVMMARKEKESSIHIKHGTEIEPMFLNCRLFGAGKQLVFVIE